MPVAVFTTCAATGPVKKAEYADGIKRLWDERAQWSPWPIWVSSREMNSDGQLHYYPARRSSPAALSAIGTSWR